MLVCLYDHKNNLKPLCHTIIMLELQINLHAFSFLFSIKKEQKRTYNNLVVLMGNNWEKE